MDYHIKRKRFNLLFFNSLNLFFCGERGIRTPGTVIPYDSLANCWFKPLTHLSVLDLKSRAKISSFLQYPNFFHEYFWKQAPFLHNTPQIYCPKSRISTPEIGYTIEHQSKKSKKNYARCVSGNEKMFTFTKLIVRTIVKFIYV